MTYIVDPDLDPLDDDTDDEGWTAAQVASVGMTVVGTLAAPVAMAVSYARNASVPWAIAHGFVAVPYLILVAITKK